MTKPDDPEELRAEARRLRVKFGVAAAVIVAAAVALGVLAGGRPVGPHHGTFRPAAGGGLDAALPLVRAFVENERDLRFDATVPVRTVDAAAFTAVTAASAVPTRPGAAVSRDLTTSVLGLGRTGGPAAPAGLGNDDVFYSYAKHAVYRREATLDGYHRGLLAYALTVALDDQHHQLLAATRTAAGNGDRLRALDSLVAGDARRVQQAYVAKLPKTDRGAAQAADRYARRPTGFAANVAAFPVTAGADFVTALVQHGGNGAVEQAFAQPPTASAQILAPARYLDGQQPVTVRDPEAGGQILDRGTLGVFGLAMLLSHGRGYLNTPVTGQWQGDQYVTVRAGGRTCVLDTVLAPNDISRDQAAHALQTALGKAGSVGSSDLDDSLTLQVCQRT